MIWANTALADYLPGSTTFRRVLFPTLREHHPRAGVSDEHEPATQADLAYVTTYYPSTADRGQASAIELHAGEDVPLDFSLARVHTVGIRGTVAGLASGMKTVVVLRGQDSNSMYNAAAVAPDGKFEIQHVAPGSYSVTAMTLMTDPPQMARTTVDVNDTNIDALRLALVAGATVRGKVRLAGTIAKSDPSLLFVYLHRDDEEGEGSDGVTFSEDGAMASPGMARVKADGSFELKNVPAGIYEVQVSGDAKGMADCFVESVIAGTKDVADTGLKVRGGTVLIDLTVDSSAGVVDGMVTNEKNEAVPDAD